MSLDEWPSRYCRGMNKLTQKMNKLQVDVRKPQMVMSADVEIPLFLSSVEQKDNILINISVTPFLEW